MKLTISKENPRFFKVGVGEEIKYLFASGQNGVPKGPLFGKMIKSGVNTFYIQMQFLIGAKTCPWLYKEGSKIESNWAGWNEAAFAYIKNEAERLDGIGCALVIIIDGSSLRRWFADSHLWNSKNGGPVPKGRNLVRGFFNYGISKQKEFLKKLTPMLPDNTLLCLNWEIYNAWISGAREWSVQMVNFCHKLDKRIPIGIGTPFYDQITYLNNRTKREVFGVFEGGDVFWHLKKSKTKKPDKFLILLLGYHCDPDGFLSQKDLKKLCACFKKGRELRNMKGTIKNTTKAIISGINPGLPFEHWLKRTGHIRKKCDNITYDYGLYQDMLFDYIREFNKFMSPYDVKYIPNKTFKSEAKRFARQYWKGLKKK